MAAVPIFDRFPIIRDLQEYCLTQQLEQGSRQQTIGILAGLVTALVASFFAALQLGTLGFFVALPIGFAAGFFLAHWYTIFSGFPYLEVHGALVDEEFVQFANDKRMLNSNTILKAHELFQARRAN